MADRLQKIKELMTRYDQAQRASSEAAKLRRQLVPLLKDLELTKTKFNFGDRNISFHKYNGDLYDFNGSNHSFTLLITEEYSDNSEIKQMNKLGTLV